MYTGYSHYSLWAENKLRFVDAVPSVVSLNDLALLSENELRLIATSIKQFNFAIYELADHATFIPSSIEHLAIRLGLNSMDEHLCLDEDRVTKIFNNTSTSKSLYIPYTNRPINWHTDGYYNNQDQIVYSFVLHCAQPAFEGGENALLDSDQVFIHLMREDPRYINALLKDDVMTIPENRKEGVLIRAETSTAIFKVLNNQHDVLMRYSMRKKNIQFKPDVLTQEALACMDEFIISNSTPHMALKLKAGQGIVCNNVLHKRTAFKDKIGSERLYYRARYYNRINIEY